MTTVANTVKDVSRAIASFEDIEDAGWGIKFDDVERIASNLAFVMGRNVNLTKITTREAALLLASHGYSGDLEKLGRLVAKRIRALSDVYGRMTSQI